MRYMSEVVLLFKMEGGAGGGVRMSAPLKDGRYKITENWLFCQHFIRRFPESRADLQRRRRRSGSEVTNKQISSSLLPRFLFRSPEVIFNIISF